jgi:hypothetical protein
MRTGDQLKSVPSCVFANDFQRARGSGCGKGKKNAMISLERDPWDN